MRYDIDEIIIAAIAIFAAAVAMITVNALIPARADVVEVPEPPMVWDTEIYGTGNADLSLAEETSDNEWEQEDYENELIEAALIAKANRIDACTVTYYCMEKRKHICGNGDGLTASGAEVSTSTCAVDPRIIPLGSTVMVDYGDGEIHYYIAEDTGGGIKNNHIDIAVPTHHEALELGKRTATVYWLYEREE